MADKQTILNNLLTSLERLSDHYSKLELNGLNPSDRQTVLNDIGTIQTKLEQIIGTQDSLTSSEIEALRQEYQALISNVQSVGETLTTEQKSVLNNLDTLQSTAKIIDESVARTNGSSNLLLNLIKEAGNICYCADSIGAGTGVIDKENVVSYNIKEHIRKIKNLLNIGFQTSLNKFNHYHTVSLGDSSNWTENYLNSNSINGFSFDTSSVNENITFSSGMIKQNSAKLYFVKNDVDSVVEIYINDTLAQTINISTLSTNNIVESNLLVLTSDLSSIKCVLVSGKMSISGISYYVDETLPAVDLFVTGGRRIRYIKDEVLAKYLTYDLMFFQLSYNDVVGGSDETQKQEVYTILESIANHYITNNKTFIYINTVWSSIDSDNWVLQKINQLFETYDKYFYFDYKSTILNSNGLIADSNYRINVLKEWADSAHPNDLGHNRFTKYLYSNIFNKFELDHVEKGLLYENYSIYNEKNSVGLNTYASLLLGVNNKTEDYLKFVGLLGIGNEATNDVCYALGEYNIFSSYNSFALGKGNKSAKSYTTLLGTYSNALNGGVVEGHSSSSSVINQKTRQHRTTSTSNAVETYLRGLDNSALLTTNENTKNVLKGNIYCYDNTNDLVSIFKISAIVDNTNNINTIKSLNGSIEGVIEELNENNVSCRVVSSGNSNFTIRVSGNTNTLKWISDFEILEFSK